MSTGGERGAEEERGLVKRALSSVRATNGRGRAGTADADAEIERAVDPEGPRWIRPTAVAISIMMPAAAAVALLLYEPKAAPATPVSATPRETQTLTPTVVELAYARTSARGPRLFRSGRVLPWQTQLVEGDRVESGASAGCLMIDPGVDVCLAPGSEVKLVSLSRAARTVRVQRGQAIARLDPQAPGDGFELRAGAVRALAQGTVYSLEYNGADDARIRVLKGHVKVLAAMSETLVSASQLATYRDAEQAVTLAALPSGQAARMWELLATRGSVSDAALKHAADWPGPPPLPLSEKTASPDGPALSADSAPALPLADGTSASASPSPSDADGEASALPNAQLATPDARARLRDAWEQLKATRWAEAAATYALILRDFPNSEEAHVVLVRLGDLQLEHLDQPTQALASFERYLREGGGALEAEARFGIVQSLSRLGRVEAERGAIEDFLVKHPASLKSAALRERLRTLSR